jgi:ATP-dependent Clp protease protease subunit
MKHYGDFGLYAKSKGISSLTLDYHGRKIENSLTPYILEERSMNVTQIDVFSRLMAERIIWIAGEVNEGMSVVTQAQLMFLDSVDNNDITLHISSPGGSVSSGLSIIDIMDYITSDVRTVNTGMAASMGAVLLGAGSKGKRSSLRFSKTMIHQSSGGASGVLADAEIVMKEWIKTNDLLFQLLGQYCDKTAHQIKTDAERDLWLSSEETLRYGLIDEIIMKKINHNQY